MLDQTTDRMWYVIGAVLIGAAIIFGMNTFMPEAFASVGGMFDDFIGKVVIGGSEEVVDDDSLQEYLARTYDKDDVQVDMTVRYVTGENLNVDIMKYDTYIDTFFSKDMMLEDLEKLEEEERLVMREYIVGQLGDMFELYISHEQEGQAMAMSDDQFVDFVFQLIRESDVAAVFALNELLVPGDSTTVLAMYHEVFSNYGYYDNINDRKWKDTGYRNNVNSRYYLTDGQELVAEYDRMVSEGLIAEYSDGWIEDIMSSNREVLMQNASFIDRYKGMSEDSLSQIFTGSSEYGLVHEYGLEYKVMYVQRDSLYEVEFLHEVHVKEIDFPSYTAPKKDGSIVINGLTYDRYIGDSPFYYGVPM